MSFYTVLLTEGEYWVNYHWHVIGKDMKAEVEAVRKKSATLGQFVEHMRARLGKCGPIEEIMWIFGAN